MTPSIPAGKYVWRDIRTTRAGSELEEEELIFKKGTKEVLAKGLQGNAQAPCNSDQGWGYKRMSGFMETHRCCLSEIKPLRFTVSCAEAVGGVSIPLVGMQV